MSWRHMIVEDFGGHDNRRTSSVVHNSRDKRICSNDSVAQFEFEASDL